ncbi:MAG: minor capsid protein [Clostridium sp.]
MPKITTRVTFNKSSTIARIKALNDSALTDMGNQALDDTTKHVPKDQGILQNSGLAESSKEAVNGVFILRWDEPYAQYLFRGEVMYGNPTERTYGPEKLNFTSALAQMEWTKYAHETYGTEWRAVYQASMKRRSQR